MIKINYHTRVFIDAKTSKVTIRIRWGKQETSFSLSCRADSSKWDAVAQRPMPGTIHKVSEQNNSAKIICGHIDKALDQIKEAFTKCELKGEVPSREVLKALFHDDQPKEEVVVHKTLDELFEEFMEVASDDRNWAKQDQFKYNQMWNHLHESCPTITLETLTKDTMRDLKNWYIDKGYRNSTITKAFGFIKSFLHWLHTEGYKINPSVLEYKTNLPVVRKTVTFLKYNELMDFYHFKFSDEEKNLELVRDQFCFMAFTSLRYSDLANLKRANVFEDHIDICTEKTDDALTIPLTRYAKEIINKYKDQNYKDGKMFRVYANQKINALLKVAAEKAGINREVVLRYYKGKTRHEEVKKFHEIIGCHDARRTFVCCSLAFGIPPTVVMSCTGHSTYSAMKPYIEVADETQRKELAKWDKVEKQNDIKSSISNKLDGVDEETLKKVLELLNSQE